MASEIFFIKCDGCATDKMSQIIYFLYFFCIFSYRFEFRETETILRNSKLICLYEILMCFRKFMTDGISNDGVKIIFQHLS